MDYAPEPVPTATAEWWAACFPQHTKIAEHSVPAKLAIDDENRGGE